MLLKLSAGCSSINFRQEYAQNWRYVAHFVDEPNLVNEALLDYGRPTTVLQEGESREQTDWARWFGGKLSMLRVMVSSDSRRFPFSPRDDDAASGPRSWRDLLPCVQLSGAQIGSHDAQDPFQSVLARVEAEACLRLPRLSKKLMT
jgi:hypothetical protein